MRNPHRATLPLILAAALAAGIVGCANAPPPAPEPVLVAAAPDPARFVAALEEQDSPVGKEPAPPEEKKGPPGSSDADELRKKTQNPVGNLISLPFEGTYDFGAPNGSAFVLNVQPVIPLKWGEWNFINRTIIPLAWVEGQIEGLPGIPRSGEGGSAWGLGDINHTTFLSPADPGSVIWGAGASLTLPTATDDVLGTGKWSAGPSVVVLGQPKPWSLGVLLRQLWSFGGDSSRESVNQFLFQPFVNYNLDDGWYLTSTPVWTANWNASSSQTWTIPLGAGAGKMVKFGDTPVNLRLQAFYNVARPDGAPRWSIMFTIQFLFPK